LRHHSICSDSPPTAILHLSLHDALPISIPTAKTMQEDGILLQPGPPPERLRGYLMGIYGAVGVGVSVGVGVDDSVGVGDSVSVGDRKSTRLNSSHVSISYAVFCLKKKTA